MSENPNRQPKGTPTGGQFAASAHAEADVDLGATVDERHGVSPAYPNGRCTGCGQGVTSDGTCTNTDCAGSPFYFTGGCCSQCGGEVIPDPDGSPGVVVHGDGDGYPDYDTDLDHAPVLDDTDDNTYQAAKADLLARLYGGDYDPGQVPAPKVNDGTTPYRLDESVQDGPVRVAFTDLGEGYSGDYDEDDPDDEPLLRLDTAVRADAGVDGEYVFTDTDGAEWVNPDSYSWCTNISRDRTSPADQRAFLVTTAKLLRDQVEHRGQYPGALTSAMEMLSHADTDMVNGAAARAEENRAART
ncbi:hypothetical protein [Nocardioides pakistanensis]